MQSWRESGFVCDSDEEDEELVDTGLRRSPKVVIEVPRRSNCSSQSQNARREVNQDVSFRADVAPLQKNGQVRILLETYDCLLMRPGWRI